MARKQSIQALLLTLSLVTPNAPAHTGPNDLPTVDSLQRLLDDKDYQGVVREAARLAAIKRDAAASIDRYAVLMLKGEAHLQLKQFQPASKAYENAADEEKVTPAQKNTALAMSLLARHATAAGYQAGGKGESIDIYKPENRQVAYKLLFESELQTAVKAVEKAKKGTTIPPISNAAKEVAELRGLEMVASDGSEKTTALLKDLAAHASETITAAVDRMAERTEALAKSANQETRQSRFNRDGTRNDYIAKRGLNSKEITELKTMRANCEELVPLLTTLEKALGGDLAATVTAVQPKVEALYKRAEEVAHDDYGTRPA